MPLTDKGQTILANMERQYGEKKGREVFYASRNKHTISGVDSATEQPPSGIPTPKVTLADCAAAMDKLTKAHECG